MTKTANTTNTVEETIDPIRLTDNDTGTVYTLDFSRDAVVFAEGRGFVLDDVFKYPRTMIPEFFFYAFRKNHPNVPRSKTDELLEKMGGFYPEFTERMVSLYNQARFSNRFQSDEDAGKNSRMTVEF